MRRASLALLLAATLYGQLPPEPFTLGNNISVKDPPFSAAGDGVKDDTAAVQTALARAAATGQRLYFPAGDYAISSVRLTTTSAVLIECAGPHATTIERHRSALQAGTPLLRIDGSRNVTIRDCGWNQKGDGTNYANAASTVYISGAGSATIDNNYSTLGQSNAFLFDGGRDIVFTNNEIDHIWNAGLAVGGTGTTSSRVYARRVVAMGNRMNEMPAGIQLSVFGDTTVITGNVLNNAALALVQDVPHSVISGNSVAGSATFGNPAGPFDCIFVEGSTYFLISGNWVSGCSKNGIFAQGSELSAGGRIQLPIRTGSILANHVDGARGAGIQVIGQSFDHSSTGGQVYVNGNSVTNSRVGISLGSMDGFEARGNSVADIETNGIVLSVVRNGVVEGNGIHNVSKAARNLYNGILIGNDNTALTRNLYIDRNTIVDTSGNMRAGVSDEALGKGRYGDSVRHCGNQIGGAVTQQWLPAPSVPSIGAFSQGDCIENFPASANQPLGWVAIAGGAPGVWSPTGFTTAPACVSAASRAVCGAAMSGAIAVPVGQVSVLVQSTAVTATSVILLQEDDSLGAALGVVCSRSSSPPRITGRMPGVSFTMSLNEVPAGSPACFSWAIQR